MKDVIIFGHGRYYRSKEENIKKLYNAAAFIDNAVNENEILFDGLVPIYNTEKIRELPPMPILIMSVNFGEMAMQLVELGADEKNILFGISMVPYYDHVEKIFNELKCNIKIKNKKFTLILDGREHTFENEKEYKEVLRTMSVKKDPYIKLISDMPLTPISRRFGLEYGKAIDRFYIEKFLSGNQNYIRGTVMEIAEDRYIKMFGKDIAQTIILHVNGGGSHIVKGNLATGEGLVENSVDCLICTQTLQFIYDIHSAVKNIYKILKPGGAALITVPLISQLSLYDYKNWGCYWRLTDQSMEKMMKEVFGEKQVDVFSYGNMKSAVAFLYGICQENMRKSDLEFYDEQFPMIVAAVCRK